MADGLQRIQAKNLDKRQRISLYVWITKTTRLWVVLHLTNLFYCTKLVGGGVGVEGGLGELSLSLNVSGAGGFEFD